MTKKLALTLVFLFPLVSFAQTVPPTNADIILRIQALEATVQSLQQELNQIVSVQNTPVFGSTKTATVTMSTSSDPCIQYSAKKSGYSFKNICKQGLKNPH